jgi:chromosome segregation ATPase
MTRSARRLEAALEGRRTEEERLREALRAQEGRMGEMAATAKVQETELRERESALERASQALTQAKEHHALLLDEVGKFESQIQSLQGERDGVREQRARLREENTQLEALIAGQQEHNRELEKKRAEALRAFTDQKAKLDAVTAAHVDLQDRHRKLGSDLELATATHKTLLAESEKHDADAKAAQEEERRCRAESGRLTALATSARKESESLSKKSAELTVVLGDLDARVTATRERLAALSGTEERLVQARAELEQIRQQHGTLTDEVGRLGAERDATREQQVTLGDEIVQMDRERSRLEGEMVDVKARHQEMVRSFEQYHSESSDARRLMGSDLAKVEAQISNAQSRQESVLSKVAEAQSRHAELVEENRRMEAAVRDLAEVEEDIRVSELIAKELEERRQTLEAECAEAQERLAKSAESVDASRADLKQLEDARTGVKKEMESLTEGEKKQRARFAELQSLNRDAEKLAADQRSEHEENLHRLTQEVLVQEAKLTRARGWHIELDQLYGELALLPEKSPEGVRYLKQIQDRKKEIAAQLLGSRAAKK